MTIKNLKEIELLDSRIGNIEKTLQEEGREFWLSDIIEIKKLIRHLESLNTRISKIDLKTVNKEIKEYEEFIDSLHDPKFLKEVEEYEEMKKQIKNAKIQVNSFNKLTKILDNDEDWLKINEEIEDAFKHPEKMNLTL
jgi:protein subunit release factor A